MKNKLMKNIGLKLMALLFAAVLWLVVVNINDPVISKDFRDIVVKVTNEEVVTNQGKTYQIQNNTQTVTVTVAAKRSVLAKISADKIVATADMSEMQIDSLIPIKVSVSGYEGEYKSAVSYPTNLQVKVEEMTGNVFPLTVTTTGSLRDGYVPGEAKTNPEKILIKGPASLINSIDKAVAKVDISGVSENSTLEAELVIYNKSGNVIDQTKLKNNLGEKGLLVDLQVLNTKNLKLDFAVGGTPAEGYVFAGLSSEPQSIQVAGTADTLKEVETLLIPASEVNIEAATEKVEVIVNILPYLPEGVELVDDTANNIIVTAKIEPLGAKTIEFPVESMKVNNLSDKLKVAYDGVEVVTLQFSGTQEALDVLDIANAVSIDLKSNTTAGSFEVPVNIDVPSGVVVVKSPVVKVILTEKKSE